MRQILGLAAVWAAVVATVVVLGGCASGSDQSTKANRDCLHRGGVVSVESYVGVVVCGDHTASVL